MQRFYKHQDMDVSNHLEINLRTAFHEAGHAAAIFLENKRKNLPAVYFHIQLQKLNGLAAPLFTRICGGRQIADPNMIGRAESASIVGCQLAYEADIINYLAGPLAEAKYVSIRDNEAFNVHLLKPDSLYNYGGSADLEEVGCYLKSFLPSVKERETKLNELFVEAFHFVQRVENWQRITALANHILNSADEHICFDQVCTVLQQDRQYANY
ncbi:hypothetical protein KEF85_10085 [Methylomonas paludis]|uniref:Peptidase M41 domain-containing protein n=1 Tax=Methylomonas paludis TaxID=1173101 RepID=A0A975R8Y9_9GAMM|nr:hypothetical protein [Methylomonas paludis]QWF69723.1 hypothetical protein KEF85_10085 [Methylomonas paludis]